MSVLSLYCLLTYEDTFLLPQFIGCRDVLDECCLLTGNYFQSFSEFKRYFVYIF